MTVSKQKDSLNPILRLCVLRRIMQKIRARRLISALAILMGEETQEKVASLPFIPRVQVPGSTNPEHQRSSSGECYPQEARRNQVGQITPTVTFRFHLGFRPLLEKPITSKMQKYWIKVGGEGFRMIWFSISKNGGAVFANKYPINKSKIWKITLTVFIFYI